MSRNRKNERLLDLMGTLDPAILEYAHAIDSSERLKEAVAASAGTVSADEGRVMSRLGRFFRNRTTVAVIAAALALAVMLPATSLLFRQTGGFTPGETENPDVYVDPLTVTAPWKDGTLKLTSLTYRVNSDTLMPGNRISFDQITAVTGDPGENSVHTGGGESTTDESPVTRLPADTELPKTDSAAETETPLYGEEENLTVSIMDNVKISAYMGSDLIKLRPDSGDHVNCPDVYYDIKADTYTCMSCRLLDLMTGSEAYADVAIHVFIEECLLSYINLWESGEMTEWRSQYASALSDTEIREQFANRKRITLGKLGELTYYSDDHKAHVRSSVGDFQYPVVDVVEYGTDMNICLFTLCSPRTGVGYGNFLCYLDSGAVISLDGDMAAEDIPNLSLASGVIVTDDYGTVIVTVPYFAPWVNIDRKSGLPVPYYTRSNIFIYHVDSGSYERLFTVGNDKIPASAVAESQGVLTYRAHDGHVYAYRDGTFYELPAEPARICTDINGKRYAAIASDGHYTLYLLEGGEAVAQDPADEALELDVANCYMVEGNQRIHLLTNETVTLWEGEPAAQVASRDGRYIYLYFTGDNSILCVDVWTGERGCLALSDSFVSEAARVGEVSYRLLLNAEENRLLMTYFTEGVVVFDSAAFLENVVFNGTHMVEAVEDIINYYTVNGHKLRFYEKMQAILMIKLLYIPLYLDATEQDNLNRENRLAMCVEAAEALIPYLDVWSSSAEVPRETVNSLLGYMAPDELTEYFILDMPKYRNYFEIPEKLPSAYGKRPDYALNGLSRALRDSVLGYFSTGKTDENAAYLEALVHERMEALVSEECTVLLCEFVPALNALLVEAAPTVWGGEYGEFLRTAAFFEIEEEFDNFRVITDDTAGDIRCGVEKYTDRTYVTEFLSGLTFSEGEVEITVSAKLTYSLYVNYWKCFRITVFELGYAADGTAYVRAPGWFAEIDPALVDVFKTEAIDESEFIA